MALITRGMWMSLASVAVGATMACDPKVGEPGDDGTLEQNDDDDDDDDGASGGTADGPDSGNDGDPGPGTSAGSGGDPDCDEDDCPEPAPAVEHAYAIRFGDLPAPGGDRESDSGGSGDPDIDPDTILVVIGNGADDCDDPWAAMACGRWGVSFSLPPGTQPGTYSLFPDLNGSFTSTGPGDESDECWFGGGSLEGTLELTAVGDVIEGHITGASVIDFDANVEFSAALCQ